jgi:hypothetical protein
MSCLPIFRAVSVRGREYKTYRTIIRSSHFEECSLGVTYFGVVFSFGPHDLRNVHYVNFELKFWELHGSFSNLSM